MATKVTSNLQVKIGADTSGLKKGTSSAQKELKSFESKMMSQFKGLGVAAAAAFSVGAIINFGKKAAEAADIQLQAESKLLVALKGREDITNELIKQAGELQGKTLFGDEETTNAAANLAAFVKSGEDIKSLVPVVQDLATALGMDLGSAATLVGKSIGSSTHSLKRYGIDVEGAAGSSERAASAVQALTDKFGGQAEAAAQVGLGPWKVMQNLIGEISEEIGKFLMPAIQTMAKWLQKVFAPEKIEAFRGKVIDLANWFIDLYNNSLPFRAYVQSLGIVFKTVWDIVKGVFSNIKNIFVSTGELLKAVLTGNFKAIPEILKNSFDKAINNTVNVGKDIAENFTDGFKNTIAGQKLELIDKNKEVAKAKTTGVAIGGALAEGIAEGAKSKYNAGGALAGGGALAAVTGIGTEKTPGLDIYEQLIPKQKTAGETIADNIAEANEQLSAEAQTAMQIVENMNQSINNSIMEMASGFAEGIGSMIAGTGSFNDIGKMMLSSLGSLAIELGTIALSAGLGIEAIKKSLSSLSGIGAIAAGLALIALGGVIKGAVGKLSGGAGGGGSSSTYDLRTSGGGVAALTGQKQTMKVEIVGETTIKNKDIFIAYKNAETSRKQNT